MKILLTAFALSTTTLVGAAAPVCAASYSGSECCRICKKGKACGDSCIAKDATCKKGKGCACNA